MIPRSRCESVRVRVFILAQLVAVLPALATRARAERIAIEAYEGQRPAEAERAMQWVRPILERHEYTVAPSLLAVRFRDRAWRNAGSRSVGTQLYKAIDKGIARFEDANLDAHKLLKSALDLARENPIAWVNEPKYRDQVRLGLLYYALSLQLKAKKERDDAALTRSTSERTRLTTTANESETERDAVMAELIRSFPTFVVKASEYGLEAEKLYELTRKQVDKLGRGSLEIDVDDANAVVYVNESVQPRKATIADLVPGAYRILVVSSTGAHEYSREVVERQRSRLVVNWALDSQLVLADWVGLQYRSAADHSKELQLVSALLGSSAVASAAVVSVAAGKRPLITVQRYDVKRNAKLASCQVTAAETNPEALKRFEECLEPKSGQPVVSTTARNSGSLAMAQVAVPNSEPDAEVSTADDEVDEPDEVTSTGSSRERSWMKWGGIGSLGVAAIGAGLSIKFALDFNAAGDELQETCAVRCTPDQVRPLQRREDVAQRNAIIAGSVGGLALAGGVVLLLLSRNSHDAAPVSLVPTPQGGLAQYTLLF